MAKTLSFGAMHLGIAFGIGYVLTGDVAVSGAIALIEPVANTVAFHFFDRHWTRLRQAARSLTSRRPTPNLVPATVPSSTR